MASEYLKWKYKDVPPDKPLVLTKKQRWNNWWHYHKWHVIIGAVLLLTTVSILRYALGIGITKPDYQIAYVGSAPLPEDTVAALESQLTAFGEDVNGDGKVVIKINQYPTDSMEEGTDAAAYASASAVRLMGDLESRQSCLFILEDAETFYENYSILADATGGVAENKREACYLRWSDCPALSGLDLGEYYDTLLGEKISGDSNALLQNLYLARRGYLPDDNEKESCNELWTRLTKGE